MPEKKQHGGPRPNSGRPREIEGGGERTVSVRVSQEQYDKYVELGGPGWVRKQLDKAKVKR